MLKNIWKVILALWDWAGRIQLLWGLIGAAVTALIAEMLKAPTWAIFGLALAGACVFIGAAILWEQRKTSQRPLDDIDRWAQTAEKFYQKESRLKKWWRKHKKQPSVLPSEFISMKEAATKLYTEARRCNSLIATGAEQLSGWAHGQPTSGTVDDILDHVAGVIAGKKDVYAKRPPSTAVEQISKDSLKMYVFKEGATKLKHILPNTPSEWTDLAIRSAALDDLIAELHFQSGFEETLYRNSTN